MPVVPAHGPFRPLTPTQVRVARCVVRGLSYRRIASALGMSVRTARAHVQAIAQLLPTDELPAYRRVHVWAAATVARDDSSQIATCEVLR